MSDTSVLIVDDDANMRKLIHANLTKRNYEVRAVASGDQAIACIEEDVPDLVIVDLVMPGISGNDVCIWIREQGLDIPIIVLSAHGEEDLKVKALDSGADDYVTKPFQTEEFLARIRAVMRRAGTPDLSSSEATVKIEGLTIDLDRRRAFVGDTDMHLTRTEFAILATLARNRDAVLTHDELLAKVWGEEYRGSNHYLHVYLGRIRKKMSSQYSSLLETVAGMGYLFHSSLPD